MSDTTPFALQPILETDVVKPNLSSTTNKINGLSIMHRRCRKLAELRQPEFPIKTVMETPKAETE
jgi:hypothetical protein